MAFFQRILEPNQTRQDLIFSMTSAQKCIQYNILKRFHTSLSHLRGNTCRLFVLFCKTSVRKKFYLDYYHYGMLCLTLLLHLMYLLHLITVNFYWL